MLSDGMLSDGMLSDGMLSDGMLSDGMLSDGMLSDEALCEALEGAAVTSKLRLEDRDSPAQLGAPSGVFLSHYREKRSTSQALGELCPAREWAVIG